MHSYICLLRAVNVGGTGKLPMADLRGLCVAAGFTDVRTYIASGNVVLRSPLTAQQVKAELEASLAEYAGKQVGVLVRTPSEMVALFAANPFPGKAPNRTTVIFLDKSPPTDALDGVSGLQDEEIALGTREIYVHYSNGMASSKLKIQAAKAGTARNMNTVSKLIQMSRG